MDKSQQTMDRGNRGNNPNPQTPGETQSGQGMLTEFFCELNPGNAHIEIRCNDLALAREHVQRLFPASYVSETADGNSWYVHLARDEKDNNKAIGSITKHLVPLNWVISRRLENIQKVA